MKSLTEFFSQLTLGKKLSLLIVPIISILASMKVILLGLWLLIFIDLLTGIRKSLHNKKIKPNPLKANFWKSIKSYMLRKTWQKTYEYSIGIITIIVLESLILGETNIEVMDKVFTISELSAIVPACVEVWSIFENFEAVSGNNMLKKAKKYLINKFIKQNDSNTEERKEDIDL